MATFAVLLAASPGLAFAAGEQMTDARIQQKLQSEGYTNVRITGHAKDHVDVKATKNGKTEKRAVNPKTGAIKPDEDNDKPDEDEDENND
ncbi:MAG: PepSY domain-containing protein [Acetobacteraceae bacterium]|nr:PepSY domain-containing protein [Acetobacteraceae bacterium]